MMFVRLATRIWLSKWPTNTSAFPSGPTPGAMPTVNAVPSGENEDEKNCRLFAPSSRILSPVPSGCAIIS